MQDKKKKEKQNETDDKNLPASKPSKQEIPDVDDLIFADEYIKLHSEK